MLPLRSTFTKYVTSSVVVSKAGVFLH